MILARVTCIARAFGRLRLIPTRTAARAIRSSGHVLVISCRRNHKALCKKKNEDTLLENAAYKTMLCRRLTCLGDNPCNIPKRCGPSGCGTFPRRSFYMRLFRIHFDTCPCRNFRTRCTSVTIGSNIYPDCNQCNTFSRFASCTCQRRNPGKSFFPSEFVCTRQDIAGIVTSQLDSGNDRQRKQCNPFDTGSVLRTFP